MIFIERLAQTLDHYKVDYVVVGGFAVALHGAVRGTVDVDLVLRLTEKNFKNAEQAFIQLGLKARLPVDAAQVFHFRKEYINKRNLIAWSFANPSNPIEIVEVIITEDMAKIKKVFKKIGNISLPVASIKDLIKMKRKSGRKQDLLDIQALERLNS